MTSPYEHNPIETPKDNLEYVAVDKKWHKIPVSHQLYLVIAILLILLGSAMFSVLKENSQFITDDNEKYKTTDNTVNPKDENNKTSFTFPEVSITGNSAYVLDIRNNQTLFSYNADKVMPLASITKLMTALLSYEIMDANAPVDVVQRATRQESALGLSTNDIFTHRSMAELILLSSANDGAYALANVAGKLLDTNRPTESFVAAMNVRAEELGLSDTNFKNPTGLDISAREAGAVGTAKDVANLLAYIVNNYPHLLTITREEGVRIEASTGGYIDATNTNLHVDRITGLIGSKTGYTDLAGGNLTVAYNAGLDRPIAVVVLGSTRFERFTDVEKLIRATNQILVEPKDE